MAELSRTQALKLLKEAAALNPGPWEKHSLNVALCAENIASACGMDGERAYVMGLMTISEDDSARAIWDMYTTGGNICFLWGIRTSPAFA